MWSIDKPNGKPNSGAGDDGAEDDGAFFNDVSALPPVLPGADYGLDIDPSKTIPPCPKLERSICLADNKSLAQFLKLSRTNVDDSIKSRINSVMNHHESSKKRSILTSYKTGSSAAAAQSPCLPLMRELIFPQWYERVRAIQFCQQEAAKMGDEIAQDPANTMDEETRNKLLRVDPYAVRDIERKAQERNDENVALRTKWDNEREIEDIIRDRSTEMLDDQCMLPAGFSIPIQFYKYSQSITRETSDPVEDINAAAELAARLAKKQ